MTTSRLSRVDIVNRSEDDVDESLMRSVLVDLRAPLVGQ
jgi:hypothetical protein